MGKRSTAKASYTFKDVATSVIGNVANPKRTAAVAVASGVLISGSAFAAHAADVNGANGTDALAANGATNATSTDAAKASVATMKSSNADVTTSTAATFTVTAPAPVAAPAATATATSTSTDSKSSDSKTSDSDSANAKSTSDTSASDSSENADGVSATRQKLLDVAASYLGIRYVWGSSSASGMDCSGYTSRVYAAVGISIPHQSAEQYAAGTKISRSQALPGDLVIVRDSGGHIYHVGLYAGGNTWYETTPGTGSVKRDIWDSSPEFVRIAGVN